MRALILSKIGERPGVGEWPDPRGPRPDEVVVKVEAAGVCYRDLLEVEGHMPRARPPLVMGHEFAGIVESVGESVNWLSEGQRVAALTYVSCGSCYNCVSGNEYICRAKAFLGEEAAGCFAEKIAVPARILARLPEGLQSKHAAFASCVVGTALRAIRQAMVEPGGTALITGAGGGVGIHAVQVAKALGLKVIASTHSEWKERRLKEVGADEVVSASDLASEVRRLTDGEGVDLVVENVGHMTLEQSFKAVKWGGKIAVIGNVGVGSFSLPLGSLILRDVTIYGVIGSSRRDLIDALRLIASGKVRPVIASERPIDEATVVLEDLKRSAGLGRHILKPEA